MSRLQDEASCSVSEEGVRDGWSHVKRKTDEKGVNRFDKPAPRRVHFLSHEHNRLAGAACFIEELKDPDSYAEYWVEYACQHRDHTAEEWRAYYEARIRPSRCGTGTAHPVHMRSYSMDDVKEYDILTPVQPAQPPLQNSQWASPQPVARWPAPEPRLNSRLPCAGSSYISWEVTHFPASKDPGLRRTVLVSNIPIGMTLTDVFSQLESDRIVEAKFAGTAGMKTLPPIESNMAIVEFLDNEDAQTYVDVYSKHAVFDLVLIGTPTRPLRRARVDSGYQ